MPRHDPEPDDVDFVVTSFDPGTDEELAQPSSGRRTLLPLAVGAVVAVLIVAAVAGRHADPHPTAAHPTSAHPTAAHPTAAHPTAPAPTAEYPGPRYALGSEIRVNPSTGAIVNIRNGRVIAQAPAKLGTVHRRTVPGSVAAALRRAFPDVHSIRTVSVLGLRDGTLRQRQITARGGGLDLRVAVRSARPGDVDRGRVTELASGVVVLVESRSGSFQVKVRAESRDATRPDFTVLSNLAGSRGLLATR